MAHLVDADFASSRRSVTRSPRAISSHSRLRPQLPLSAPAVRDTAYNGLLKSRGQSFTNDSSNGLTRSARRAIVPPSSRRSGAPSRQAVRYWRELGSLGACHRGRNRRLASAGLGRRTCARRRGDAARCGKLADRRRGCCPTNTEQAAHWCWPATLHETGSFDRAAGLRRVGAPRRLPAIWRWAWPLDRALRLRYLIGRVEDVQHVGDEWRDSKSSHCSKMPAR